MLCGPDEIRGDIHLYGAFRLVVRPVPCPSGYTRATSTPPAVPFGTLGGVAKPSRTADSTSTIPDPQPLERLKRARAGRRVTMAIAFLIVVAALVGLLGVRTREVSAAGGGYEMTVTFATMTRPGLATPFDVEVSHPAGMDEQVTLAVSNDYLAAFDENGLDPDPAISRSDEEFVYWTFEPSPGNTLGVSFDARLEPAVQWKREGEVRLIREGRTLVVVPFTTWVMP